MPYHYFRGTDYERHRVAGATVELPTPYASQAVLTPTNDPVLNAAGQPQITWANADSFQIISAGLDKEYGDFDAKVKLHGTRQDWSEQTHGTPKYAESEYVTRDDLVNFSTKTVEDAVDD
jgi:hypothetical protein